MDFLSRLEEILLLAIWKLKDNAYGMSIRKQVEKDTGYKWVASAIYAPLSRLKKNGYVTIHKGEATPERGGRHKIYYRLTSSGFQRLRVVQEVSKRMWADTPDLMNEDYV